jgi:hypothetical protein
MKALLRALKPVRLRVRLARAARASGCTLFSAAAFMLGLRIAMFFTPVERPAVFLLPFLALMALVVAAAFLWPVSVRRAVRAADDCGLRQRALTALELSQDPSPMAHLQREDALKALRALDAKRALPVRISRKWLTAMALCVALSSALYFVPNPQNSVIAEKQLTRAALEEQAKKIEDAADALPASADPDQLAQLQKLARELAQALKTSESSRDALIKLNEAGDAIRRIERQQVQSAVGAASKALGAGGLNELQKALESGDADQLQKAMESLAASDQGALSQALSSAAASAPAGSALQAALQNAAQAAPGAAQSAALNQLAGKLSTTASSASASQLSALVASAKAGLGGASGAKGASTGSGAGMGKKGSGSGSGGAGVGGQGQGAGSGAGMGTTNKDAGYREGGARRPSSNVGSGAPVVKTGAYESIYDPTRLGDGGEISQSTGQVSEGHVSRADLAPGLGSAGGAVPFAQGARSYGQAAARAADRPGVPQDVQKLVNAYFSALIDESEG